MSLLSPQRLSLTTSELPEANLLLPDQESRTVLPLALSLSKAWGARLFNHVWEQPGAHLPNRLQKLMRGHRDSAADRAVHNLIASAFKGNQVPLLPLPSSESGHDNTRAKFSMLGWRRGTQVPQLRDAALHLDHSDDLIALLVADKQSIFEEVLLVEWSQSSDASKQALRKLQRGLEGPYPVWYLEASTRAQLSRAQLDLGPRSLLLLTPCAQAKCPLDRIRLLEGLSPGPVGLLLEPSPQRSRFLSSFWEFSS